MTAGAGGVAAAEVEAEVGPGVGHRGGAVPEPHLYSTVQYSAVQYSTVEALCRNLTLSVVIAPRRTKSNGNTVAAPSSPANRGG